MSLDLELLNKRFETSSPQDILEWAMENYWPSIVMSSSFQTQSIPLLHIISRMKLELPIIFLDTGYHFPETCNFKEMLRKKWALNIIDLRNENNGENNEFHGGEPLHRTNPDRCCYIHKVEPMMKAVQDKRAWIAGIRHEQTAQRSRANIFECQSDGLIKVNPILNWTQQDLWKYIHDHDLPLHPLYSQGYLSVGCAPCTRPVQPGESERAGRWADTGKIECGLFSM
jgi:phosphoadenosine phosphosulfate reductase